MARSFARETVADGAHRKPLQPAVATAMESAVAVALKSVEIVERRETGGWVVRYGKQRCIVAPKDIPYFMQGMAVMPQCEIASTGR